MEYSEQISSEDLWIIFTSCPLEKGKVEVYNEYCKAKVREKNALTDLSM